jgi:hypothetical protein
MDQLKTNDTLAALYTASPSARAVHGVLNRAVLDPRRYLRFTVQIAATLSCKGCKTHKVELPRARATPTLSILGTNAKSP